MRAEDLAFAWAAYRQGAFPGLDAGIPAHQFWDRLRQSIEARRRGAGMTTLLAKVGERGIIPVGWVLGWRDALMTGRGLELRVSWSPWASARNKLESAAAFLKAARGSCFMGCCKKSETRLYERLTEYGLARECGVIRGLYGPDGDGVLFQNAEMT